MCSSDLGGMGDDDEIPQTDGMSERRYEIGTIGSIRQFGEAFTSARESKLPGWARQGEGLFAIGPNYADTIRSDLTTLKMKGQQDAGLDCTYAAEFAYLSGLKYAMGDNIFNSWASSVGLSLRRPQSFLRSEESSFLIVGNFSHLQVGDLVYFANISTYDPRKGPWIGENTVYGGTNSEGEQIFYGAGLKGPHTEIEIRRRLATEYFVQTDPGDGSVEHRMNIENKVSMMSLSDLREVMPSMDGSVMHLDAYKLETYIMEHDK